MGYYHPMLNAMGEAGDPGLRRFLRKHVSIRKIRRGVGRLARFVPGPQGALLSRFGLAGDPGLGDFFRGIGSTVKGFVSGGGLSNLEGRAAEFLRTPAGKVVAGGALAAGGALVGRSIHGGGASGFGGAGHRRHRMNPLNPHALNRAIRRVKALDKLYHSVHVKAHPEQRREMTPKQMRFFGKRRRRKT